MTEEPVAVLVVDGTVVVVFADGDVVEVAGPVVLVDVDVVEVDEAPVDVDVSPGAERAPPALTEDPFVVVVLEAMPRVRGADFVWKASTPASPAAVATATIGPRFMGFVSLWEYSQDRPASQCESLVVDPVIGNAELASGTHGGVAEPSGPADVDVSLREVGDEMPERPSIEAHLVALADHLV